MRRTNTVVIAALAGTQHTFRLSKRAGRRAGVALPEFVASPDNGRLSPICGGGQIRLVRRPRQLGRHAGAFHISEVAASDWRPLGRCRMVFCRPLLLIRGATNQRRERQNETRNGVHQVVRNSFGLYAYRESRGGCCWKPGGRLSARLHLPPAAARGEGEPGCRGSQLVDARTGAARQEGASGIGEAA